MPTVEEFIGSCRQKLIDLSRRNRMLNWKRGGNPSGVDFVGEHPAAFWRLLVQEERKLSLRGIAGRKVKAGDKADAGEQGDQLVDSCEADESDLFSGGYRLPSERSHLDLSLDVALTPEQLSIRLRRISDLAASAREEQGVETLFIVLGCLTFFENETSDIEFRAPLILVPINLERKAANSWQINIRDDEPLVNPALIERLKTLGAQTPQLPDDLETFNPDDWFAQLERSIADRSRWKLHSDVALGIISYQKFPIHEDLRLNAKTISKHPAVIQLATRMASSGLLPELPLEVRELVLDEAAPPEKVTLVVDADSTQLRALCAVARGHNLVIEGPPGTGKSQTITNLIAAALEAGKSVLFVAEKQAALNVVFDRLKKQGLGNFCFELHSSKANKSAVIKELGRSLDASLSPQVSKPFNASALSRSRAVLNDYVKAVHGPQGKLGWSVYRALGRLVKMQPAPETMVSLDAMGTGEDQLACAIEACEALSAWVARFGDPRQHPWRAPRPVEAGLNDRKAIDQILKSANSAWKTLNDALARIELVFTVGERKCEVSDQIQAFLSALDEAGGAAIALADDDKAVAIIAELTVILDRGRRASEFLTEIGGRLEIQEVGVAHHSAGELVLRYAANRFRWVRSDWRAARRLLKGLVRPSAWSGAAEAAQLILKAIRLKQEMSWLHAQSEAAARLGNAWRCLESSWDECELILRSARDCRTRAEVLGLCGQIKTFYPPDAPLRVALHDLALAASTIAGAWRELVAVARWPMDYGADSGLVALATRLRMMGSAVDGHRAFNDFFSAFMRARATVARPFAELCLSGRLHWQYLNSAFLRRFYEVWLDTAVQAQPALKSFSGHAHEAQIAKFRRLDEESLQWHRTRLAAHLSSLVQEKLRNPQIGGAVSFLRDQISRQRGHKPVRQLIASAGAAVRAMKPCFLMSPTTVSLYLGPHRDKFDLVVFDEASQMPPADALGAIARGNQLVVVGDPKQLPPTNFFSVATGQAMGAFDAIEDHDSVLELATAAGFSGARLRWHYRSRHESLIAFSNKRFYDSSLYTFPSSDTDSSVRGVQFEYVKDGVYEGAGVNHREAARVVDCVIGQLKAHPTKSLGVGTMNQPQQVAIQDALEQRRQADPELDALLGRDSDEPFFVKNLENIQGDERDVVILSVTYGRGPEGGRPRAQFGPINGPNGWRRLNVLTTRARERMIVISSMLAHELDLSASTSVGASLLRDFLQFAETGKLPISIDVRSDAETESPFEDEVRVALERAGIQVQPQVGVGRYRIDFGVRDPDSPSRFICGIECDGAAYHASESARDRDRLRERQLNSLGWRLHRVWSTDWWFDSNRQMERLLALIQESRSASKAVAACVSPEVNVDSKSARSDQRQPPMDTGSGTQVCSPRATGVEFDEYRRYKARTRPTPIPEASVKSIAVVVAEIVLAEGPIHHSDLRRRVMEAFGNYRLVPRVQEGLRQGEDMALREGKVINDSDWWQVKNWEGRPRSREGTDIPSDRIAPVEFDVAVVHVLAQQGPLHEDAIVAAVRDGFGYGAASTEFVKAVHEALARLETVGRLGLASGGRALLT